MSTFGNETIVTTRKPHRCEACGRTVPKGSKAKHIGGMWEGEWQNWYMCMPCEDNHVYEDGEEVSTDDFMNWLYDTPEYQCPKCNDNPEWDWSKDDLTVEFYCNTCKNEWNKHIGFDERMNN